MMRHAIQAIDPHGAHPAWSGLLFPEHEMVNHQRPIRAGEKFAEVNGTDRRVALVQVPRALLKDVVL